eukprot:RCo041019
MGLYEFFRSQEFADCVVEVAPQQFRCHRVVLAYRSEYFRKFFGESAVLPATSEHLSAGGSSPSSSTPKEQPLCCSLTFPCDVEQVFPQVLYYLYEGHLPVEISLVDSIALLIIAVQLQITALADKLGASLLSAMTTPKIALTFLSALGRSCGAPALGGSI